MRSIEFSAEARADLDDIFSWIARDSPRQALRMIEAIEGRVRTLQSPLFDQGGHPEIHSKTLRLIEGRYEIFYEVDEDLVTVIAVLHGARDLDSALARRSRRP